MDRSVLSVPVLNPTILFLRRMTRVQVIVTSTNALPQSQHYEQIQVSEVRRDRGLFTYPDDNVVRVRRDVALSDVILHECRSHVGHGPEQSDEDASENDRVIRDPSAFGFEQLHRRLSANVCIR